MKQVWRIGGSALVISMAATLAAQAAGRPKADPDWPCHQAKVVDFPLASVWDGPPIETMSTAERDDPVAAGLAAQMTQRRVPIVNVQAAVDKLLGSPDPKARIRVAQAFAAAFEELVRQRSEIIAGLDRFGRKQREMAERIRAENAAAPRDGAQGLQTEDQALQKLQWDLRVFDDRRRTAGFVCEAPQAIETRIGDIVKVVRAAF